MTIKRVDRVQDNTWLFIDKTKFFSPSTTEQRNKSALISAKASSYVLQTANKNLFNCNKKKKKKEFVQTTPFSTLKCSSTIQH